MIHIFVNGTFDVLHPGHVALLKHARGLGDNLLVAIDSDRRVRELKGPGRPFFNQLERKQTLESLRWVDRVAIFDTDAELEHIIKLYEPDVMVKGSDYVNKPIIGEEHCGRIEFFKRIDEYSSTKAIQHLTRR
jgi:D-beta-D-heptose 7-phosphate kinase/D-beta-D-heptose 1-phosphate adenosyltransferase